MRLAVTALALTALAAAPAHAQGQRVSSPRDTARAEVAGATILVDYGRPSVRGREIFGGLVPWDAVWRAGANAATTLVTSKALVIGGTAVPAGTYTLYTIPGRDRWTLIVNRQTGQWGTEYHADRDLARIAMTTAVLPEPVEQFTIRLDVRGGGGTLRLQWDRTEAAVPFTVRE